MRIILFMVVIKSMIMIIKINHIWINDLFMIMVITIIIIINMMITIMISRGRVMMGMRGMSRGPGRPPLSNMGAMPRSILMTIMMMMMKTMMLMMMMMMMMMMIMIMVIRMMGRGSRGGLLPSVRGRPSLVSNGMGRGIMPGEFMTMMTNDPDQDYQQA